MKINVDFEFINKSKKYFQVPPRILEKIAKICDSHLSKSKRSRVNAEQMRLLNEIKDFLEGK